MNVHFVTAWIFPICSIVPLLLLFKFKRLSGKLLQEKQKLEKSFKDRTKELGHKNRQVEHMEHQNLLLREELAKLKEMDRLKSRFFADISHEFRTPLALILGLCEGIRGNCPDREIEKKIDVALRNSRQLLTLINQLLDLSKFDNSKMKLISAPQKIVPFLKGIVESFEFIAEQNKLDLEFEAEDQDTLLYYDAEKIEKVMVNLLANAVKFTGPGGKITVSAGLSTGKDFFETSVRDTGIGIPNDQLPHIFDRYYQVGTTNRRHTGGKGVGIGLALTREMILLHHGSIDVHSLEAQGTEFVLRFPMGTKHLKPGEIAIPSNNRYFPQTVVQSPIPVRPGQEEWKIPGDKQEIGKDLILVVEDNPDMRNYLRSSLERNFRVIEAADGQEGIQKARGTVPDLVVCDIRMPEADGYEVCRVLKKHNSTGHIPVILLTARASEESIIHGLETGADDYITKPFSTKILSLRIRTLIHLRRELKEKMQRQIIQHPDETPVLSMDTLFIKEVKDIIEENLSNPGFNVDQLAGKLYISRSGLYKKLYPLTGKSPVQFIRSYRLERAAQLLKARFGNVTEVALEVGFANVSYFSKCFKELFQEMPSVYLEDP